MSLSLSLFPSLSLFLSPGASRSSHTLTDARVHTCVHVCVCCVHVCEYTYDRVHALARSCALAMVAARNFGSIIERSGDRKIPALFRARPPQWGEPDSHWLGRLVILARRWYKRG